MSAEELRKAYPTASDAVMARLSATMARIGARVDDWQAEEREKLEALAWCRANGNPHKGCGQ